MLTKNELLLLLTVLTIFLFGGIVMMFRKLGNPEQLSPTDPTASVRGSP